MKIKSPQKIPNLLLNVQKNKFYYNAISRCQLNLAYRAFSQLFVWVRLSIEINWASIRWSFLILVIVISLAETVVNQTGPVFYVGAGTKSSSKQIQLDKQAAKNLPKQIQLDKQARYQSDMLTVSLQIQLEKQAKYLPNLPRITTSFLQFTNRHSKHYVNPQEQLYRSIVFSKNRDKINANNQKLDRKFNMNLNKFADLTPLEFSQTFTNLFKSDQNIKIYTQKLLDHHHFYDPNDNQFIHQTNFITNHLNYFSNFKDYLFNHLADKKNNILKHNSNYNLVQEAFDTSDSYNPMKITKNQALINHFDSYLVQKHKTIPSSLNSYLSLSTSPYKTDPLYVSVPHQLKKFIQSSTTVVPLKLTGDNASSNSAFSSNSASVTGNFSSFAIDWTVHAGNIRYQGICGACYTFAPSDVVSSLFSIYKFGFFVPLSTQQVVDCSTNGLTYGCNGGFLEGSYAYMQIKGIQTDSNYPYTSAVSGMAGTCKKNGGTFKISSFRNIEQGNCKALVNQLNYGPVSIGIAGYRLQFYAGGIFNDCNNYVDHAVVLISYKSGVGWKIKNSWGPDWGMNGFAWIADGNNCGICNMGVSARI